MANLKIWAPEGDAVVDGADFNVAPNVNGGIFIDYFIKDTAYPDGAVVVLSLTEAVRMRDLLTRHINGFAPVGATRPPQECE
jgi:hypothetical protein